MWATLRLQNPHKIRILDFGFSGWQQNGNTFFGAGNRIFSVKKYPSGRYPGGFVSMRTLY